MAGRFLLDTNIVIALFEDDPALNVHRSAEFLVPAIVAGELLFGVAKSKRRDDNLARLERFLAITSVLPCDLAVARQYGMVRYRLRVRGSPIPENDMWIAAVALAHDLPLVTRDGHFNDVEGLTVVHW